MSGTARRKVLIWSVIINLFFSIYSCQTQKNETIISGFTQGTTYTVKIIGESDVAKDDIDSILHLFDMSLSTYIDSSVISKLNNCVDSVSIIDHTGYFKTCYNLAYDVYEGSGGAFDPSVYPLVEGWGFMKNMETPLDSIRVDSILNFVGFKQGLHHSISFSGDTINFKKRDPRFKIDFNAIAQGLSVDVISDYLKQVGLTNYYVEIGGEIYVSGLNADGLNWSIGIDMPDEENYQHDLENIVYVSNKAIATSGNYRKYYIKEGVKYAHTLDPKSGFPVKHSLLSSTVIADKCALADAYATAFMVVGTDNAISMCNKLDSVEAYLLFSEGENSTSRASTDGFKSYLK